MDHFPSLQPAADQLYWSRPSLAQLRALNLAAFALMSRKETGLAVVSNSFYAVEMIKRTSQDLVLVGTGVFEPHLFCEHMDPWTWGSVKPSQLEDLESPFPAMVWAEPLAGGGERVLRKLTQLAARGCALEIIASSGFRPSQEDGRIKRRADLDPLSPGTVRKLLRRSGWGVDAIVPFQGLRAAFWQRLGSLFQKIGWLAWSDRCILTMNNQMREPAWAWRQASLVLIRARKT